MITKRKRGVEVIRSFTPTKTWEEKKDIKKEKKRKKPNCTNRWLIGGEVRKKMKREDALTSLKKTKKDGSSEKLGDPLKRVIPGANSKAGKDVDDREKRGKRSQNLLILRRSLSSCMEAAREFNLTKRGANREGKRKRRRIDKRRKKKKARAISRSSSGHQATKRTSS